MKHEAGPGPGDRPVRSHRASLPPPGRLDHVHIRKILRLLGWDFLRTGLHRDSVSQTEWMHSCSSGPFSKFQVCRQHRDGLREPSFRLLTVSFALSSFWARPCTM